MEENSFVSELTGKIKNLFSLEGRVSVITGASIYNDGGWTAI